MGATQKGQTLNRRDKENYEHATIEREAESTQRHHSVVIPSKSGK